MCSQKYYYYFLVKLQKILNGIKTRSLINIWIPSVFLSGNGNHGPGGAHYHVYQVYLRIRDEEWNIYR